MCNHDEETICPDCAMSKLENLERIKRPEGMNEIFDNETKDAYRRIISLEKQLNFLMDNTFIECWEDGYLKTKTSREYFNTIKQD